VCVCVCVCVYTSFKMRDPNLNGFSHGILQTGGGGDVGP
jgi:hypothetical protein